MKKSELMINGHRSLEGGEVRIIQIKPTDRCKKKPCDSDHA